MIMYDDLDEIIRPRFQTSVQKNFDTSWTCSMCGTYMIHTCSKKHTLCTNESKKLVSGPATWSAWLTYLRTHQVHKKYVYTYTHVLLSSKYTYWSHSHSEKSVQLYLRTVIGTAVIVIVGHGTR